VNKNLKELALGFGFMGKINRNLEENKNE